MSTTRTLALLTLLAGALFATGTQAAGAAGPLPTAVEARCPKVVPEVLPGDALAGATRAALSQAHPLYRDLNLDGMRATEAVLAPFNPDRGGYARKCGTAVDKRTVVVYLEFPAMKPSASLSEGVVLVSRLRGSYRVWAVLH
jgi:hypothetical protein